MNDVTSNYIRRQDENIPEAVSSIERCGRFPAMETFYRVDSRKSSEIKPIRWSDVVFMVFTYDSRKADELLGAQYQTWMKRVGKGADIVLITDGTDKRNYEEILPYWKDIEATSHLYRSPAVNEGKHLRFKVMDGFRHVKELFKMKPKKYFLKIDTDTFVVPDNLLHYLNEVEKKTYGNPVYYGYAVCKHDLDPAVCYGAGSGYGFNNMGFDMLNNYLKTQPNITEEYIQHPKYHTNLNVHEDFMIGNVYKRATNYPIVHNRIMYPFSLDRYGAGFHVTKQNSISYHKLELPDFFYTDHVFYNENGTQRTYDEISEILERTHVLKERYRTSYQ